MRLEIGEIVNRESPKGRETYSMRRGTVSLPSLRGFSVKISPNPSRTFPIVPVPLPLNTLLIEEMFQRKQLKREEDARRRQKEIEEKERMRLADEQKAEREANEMLQRARQSAAKANGDEDAIALQREMLRQQEQERRQREALANGVDLTSHMELMANFEANF